MGVDCGEACFQSSFVFFDVPLVPYVTFMVCVYEQT